MKKVITTAAIGLALLGGAGSAFAATTSKNPNQADLLTLKQLHQQEVNLNTQIKQENQAIKTDLAKKYAANKDPRKQRTDEMAEVKPLRHQLKTLKEQLKQANQHKADKKTMANLKQQIKSMKAEIQAKVSPIKTQRASLKKVYKANKQLKAQLKPIRQEIKATKSELKELAKQRKALNTKLKTERQAKNKTAVKADLNKAISLAQSTLKLKQKLLQEDKQIISLLNK